MNSSFWGTWRCMVDDPPKKSGRYCVAHRGNVFGDAYYIAELGTADYKAIGWAQIPSFNPNAWLDGEFDIPSRDSKTKFYGIDHKPCAASGKTKETPTKPKWWKRFGRTASA